MKKNGIFFTFLFSMMLSVSALSAVDLVDILLPEWSPSIAESNPQSFFDENEPIVYTKRLSRFENTKKFDRKNAAALCEINLNVSRASGSSNSNLAPPPRFDLAIPIIARDPISHRETIFAYIFVSTQLDMVVLSFTATENLAELISDLRFIQVNPLLLNHFKWGTFVETGFYDIYLTIYQKLRETIPTLLNSDTQFVISGHSLGGALTTLGAYDLADYNPIVYTFASPRTGNPLFAQTYNSLGTLKYTWRICNSEDIVTDLPFPEFPLGIALPPLFVYEHVGSPIPFTLNLSNALSNHIQAYEFVVINGGPPANPRGIYSEKEAK